VRVAVSVVFAFSHRVPAAPSPRALMPWPSRPPNLKAVFHQLQTREVNMAKRPETKTRIKSPLRYRPRRFTKKRKNRDGRPGCGASRNGGDIGRSCRCPTLTVAPFGLVIRNGFAQFQGASLTFQGYVNPQGVLSMVSQCGQTFQGQIDPHFVLTSRAADPNCAYGLGRRRITPFRS
jgi:hypothetical protein